MPTTTHRLQCYLDAPGPKEICNFGTIYRGWAFSEDNNQIREVRLVAGELIAEGCYGTHRPDVRAELPAAPSDYVGWEIRVILPPGDHPIVIEFLFPDGKWVQGLHRWVRVRRSLFPKWAPWNNHSDLLRFQCPAHAAHPPRPISPEQFPHPFHGSAPLPKLSIVTPSYNQGWALAACMDSVLEQGRWIEGKGVGDKGEGGGNERELEKKPGEPTSPPLRPPRSSTIPPLEVDYVVQDGGSSDDSPEVIRARAPQLAAWESSRDGGQAHAICRGFAKTSGRPTDLMAWINSDDFYLPGALRYVAEYFAHHPEVDVVYGHRVVIDRGDHEIARWFLPPHDNNVLQLCDFVPQETLFWRRRIWDKVGGLDTSLQFAMDWDLLLRFQTAGARIVRVPYFLGCFRVHAQQKTTSQILSVGQQEIDTLRKRTFGRIIPQIEIETQPLLYRYLRKSAWIEQLWRWGIRAR